ncbi:MAG: hypothetical protein QOJ38_346 [Solirubrobacterales bacterium]|jgi:hypothetical protein|nr:hypothetical protein [Solirubrobacterales bacterium]
MQGFGGIVKTRARVLLAALVAVFAVLIPALASAHVERASYWPDSAPDRSIKPAAGGKVPVARTLASALDRGAPGNTRVVCQHGSLGKVRDAIARARRHGYDIRPHDHRSLSRTGAARLLSINKQLMRRCGFSEIQTAVMASRNNDRVVVMPGLYKEPTARKAPTDDPACASLKETNDKGSTGALSYRYQYKCPNDQNLIAVMGRRPNGSPPQPPASDRHGIPDLGACIRCNVQLEGSGVSADDVIVEGGDAKTGNHGPGQGVKDVGVRADRADGFVLRNMTIRHVNEHAIYVMEADGYLLDRFKTFYAGEYGVLTFVEDHGVMQNCEAKGSGDAGLYPGAGAETGSQRDTAVEPKFRYNQRIHHCDSHHNTQGYSGTDGNAIHVDHNNFYDNSQGFTTDVFTAPGHPGYPQDSDLIEHNNFYSNNFDTYPPNADPNDVISSTIAPVGDGLMIAGGNGNVIRNNRFWDNWRRGVMIFSVPDQFVCGPAGVDPSQLAGCNPSAVPPSTSYDNEVYGNVMGKAPDGTSKPNGDGAPGANRTDFWWDEYPANTGNCWHDNGSFTSTPPPPVQPGAPSEPHTLPDDCATSAGTGGAYGQEAELVNCLLDVQNGTGTCDWFDAPPRP